MLKTNRLSSLAISDSKGCLFLLIMAYIIVCLVTLLNVYIAYNIITYFIGDGFSFMGGLFLAVIYILTIPINIISFRLIPKISKPDNKVEIFYIIVGILFTIAGILLHRATPIWPLVVMLGLLLLTAAILCQKQKKKNL
ncbi:MAG: hypothetical protein KAG64_09335 [Bacteroidales bacterium]|nr:hypothetical protein [Bacteroidales bacterium]